jgi:hypothetical protein
MGLLRAQRAAAQAEMPVAAVVHRAVAAVAIRLQADAAQAVMPDAAAVVVAVVVVPMRRPRRS